MPDLFRSSPFSNNAPTPSGLPAATVISINEEANLPPSTTDPLMPTQLATPVGGNLTAPGASPGATVLPVGSAEKVKSKLVEWLKNELTAAKQNTSDLHKRAENCIKAKGRGNRSVASGGKKAEELGSKIYDSEAADQVDDEVGLLKDLILQDGKLCRVDAGPSERPERAMVVQQAMEYELAKAKAEDETEIALHRYVLLPGSGFKVYQNFKKGYPCFGIEAANVMLMAFSDVNRRIEHQHSIHFAHFFTQREMRRSGFQNLKDLGSPDGTGKNVMSPNADPNNNGNQLNSGNKPNETYEVYESWGEPPWVDWVLDGSLSDADLNEFALLGGFQPEDIDLDSGDKHCFFWKENTLLKWHPNYLPERTEYPVYMASHFPGENQLFGEAQMERVADSHNAKHVALNHMMDNMRLRGNMPRMYRYGSMNPDMLKLMDQARGTIPIASNDDFEQVIKFIEVPNIAPDMMQMLNYFQGRIESGGVDDAMRGASRPRTATQSQNEQIRGQTQINNSGGRFVRQALAPACRSLMHMIIANYTAQQWRMISGEDGAEMITEPWMREPDDIDRHFKIIPVATFDFSTQSAKIAEIVNLTSAFAPFLMPEQGRAAYEEAMKMTSLKKHQVERIMQIAGTATDALAEVEAMIDNHWHHPEVLPSDDHQTALLVAQSALMANPQLEMQDNFRKWHLKHQLFAFQQMQMQAMQQVADDPAGSAKGARRNQIPKGGIPTDESGQSRQRGQQVSPPDQQQYPGMSGMGAMMGMAG
jgi:hypothetical protein